MSAIEYQARGSILILLVVMILLLNVTTAAASPDPRIAAEAYNKAGELYQKGLFTEALIQYETLIGEDIANPDLFYNAANAAYRTGNLGLAVLYNERAAKLAPGDPDILANRTFFQSKTRDEKPSPDSPVVASLNRWYNAITLSAVELWSGLAFALAGIFGAAALFFVGWRRIVIVSFAGTCLFVFAISTVMAFHKHSVLTTQQTAVIMVGEVQAFSGPADTNTHIFTLHEGSIVVIERSEGSWNLIRLKHGAGGWINASAMRDI